MALYQNPRQNALKLGQTAPGAKLNFYEPGTTTAKGIYDADGNALSNPVVADSNGIFATIYGFGPYKVVMTDSNDSTLWTEDDYYFDDSPSSQVSRLLYTDGAANSLAATSTGSVAGDVITTTYFDSNKAISSGAKLAFTGTTTLGKAGNCPDADGYFYDVDGKQFKNVSDVLTVTQWGALLAGDETATTAGISAAIAYSKTFSSPQNECFLYWPGGDYNVTTLNFLSANRLNNISQGAVNIYGKSVGGTAIISVDGSSGSTFTRNLNWQGLFAVQIGSGGSYSYGVYMDGVIDSRWVMSVSGAYSTNTVFLDVCFNNPQLDFTASNSSGTAISTIKCGANNVNRNHFNCRTTGSSDMGVASVGLELAGNANIVEGDFSSSQIGIDLVAARGTTIISPYHEINKTCIRFSSNPLGTTILGGLYEVGTNGYAFDLSSSQHTTIIGPRVFGISGGSTRTVFNFGSAAYSVTVQNPDVDAATIDASYAGTWRGEGGFNDQFNSVIANWVSFPSTQISSSDVNTLDDYEELTFTPVLMDSSRNTGGESQTTSVAAGFATKTGDMVEFTLYIAMTSLGSLTSGDQAYIQLGNLPASLNTTGNLWGCTITVASGLNLTAGDVPTAYIGNGVSYLTLERWTDAGTAGTSAITVGQISATGALCITGKYKAAT